MKYFIFGFSLLFSGVTFAQEAGLSSVLENRKGIEALKKENPSLGQKHFLDALAKDPLNSRLQLNLGFSFEKLDQIEKARSAYETAAQFGKDSEVLFAANYNLGVLYQKEKKTPEALQAYQEALKYNPDSVETKTNIELLTQDQQGKGDSKDPQNQGQQGQDKKDQQQSNSNDQQDQKKEGQDQGEQQKDENKPKEYAKNKPQPKPFKSGELSQGDVNKILGEIKQQEQKIRAEFNKKDAKEKAKDKDW